MTAVYEKCDGYLDGHTGTYKYRCRRYDAVIDVIEESSGLSPSLTIADLGAGWTEFGHRLTERGFRGRYLPYDGAIDGKDLTFWQPPLTPIDWIVAIELLGHLHHPERLTDIMMDKARRGVIITTPNSQVVDTLAVRELWPYNLREMGFRHINAKTLSPGSYYRHAHYKGREDEFGDTLVAWTVLA